VALRPFDSPQSAQEAMRAGLRRLFMLQLSTEMRDLASAIDREEQTCLHYATLGNCDELKADLLIASADHAFFMDDDIEVRTHEAFAARAEAGWRRLNSAAAEVIDFVRQSLPLHHALSQQLSATFPPLWSDSIRDMGDQLGHLVYPGFVIATPFPWLGHLHLACPRRSAVGAGPEVTLVALAPDISQGMKRTGNSRISSPPSPRVTLRN
jgi:ATP-dependent helicase HrpA